MADRKLFFPERFTKEIIDNAKLVLGPVGYACQYGQAIAAIQGGNYERGWFNWYGQPAPTVFDVVNSYWDLSFKKGAKNSYVVGQLWGKIDQKNYLLFQYRDKAGINESIDAILDMVKKFPAMSRVVIEGKANGPAIMDLLERTIPNMMESWPPDGTQMDSKEARWMAAAPIARQKNVWLPYPEEGIWAAVRDPQTGKTAIDNWVDEITRAPNTNYKDQIDTFAMAMLHLNNDSLNDLRNFVSLMRR